ncbi:response regulator transcription factor, partial [Roseateles sp. GG27B]
MKILLADDHELFRAGLRALLTDIAGVVIVGEARDGEEAVQLAAATAPDLVFVDIAMPVM